MGGSQSSRKISVDNENAIQVSQEAIDRIQSQLNAKQAERPPKEPEIIPPYYEYTPPSRAKEHAAEEAYWARRIEALKLMHKQINESMQAEYNQTLQATNDLLTTVEASTTEVKLTPCQAEKAKVLQCYSTNPNQTLLCSAVVNEFNNCVCKSRISAVSAS